MFFRKKENQPPADLWEQRLKQVVRESRDRPATTEAELAGEEPDVMRLLVELRAAARRGGECPAARSLGAEFNRYLPEFYKLAPELQSPAIQGLLQSRRQEQNGDLETAVHSCETALQACPDYLPLLERLAALEKARGQKVSSDRWYLLVLGELDRLDLFARSAELCRQLVSSGVTDPDLLERCGQRLETEGDLPLAARAWSTRAVDLMAAGRPADALVELDRALEAQPDNAQLHLDLALIYQSLGEPDRAAAAFQQAEALTGDDPDTLGRLILLRARVTRPDETTIGRLMDLLDASAQMRSITLQRCEDAVKESPYNPHLRFIQGVLLAQDRQLDPAAAALRIAVDRYVAQSDRGSELEARLALQTLAPNEEENRRRIAELFFERGEVHLAMQALAGLARVARGAPGS